MRSYRQLLLLLSLFVPGLAAAQNAPPTTAPAAAPATSAWLYRGSDITPDPAWRMGILPNGLRYAVRRNARPERQVSIRIRIDAGSLNETPEQQGWAHLLEHLVFRGSTRYADREARHIWEQLGASFGSDTNATTSTTQTVYQLDLPNAGREALDRSLSVMADMMSSALIAPDAVAAERQIVIAEKERRPELAVRMSEASRRLFLNGMTFASQETIGTDATLNAATADSMRAFYRRWYRPERATVVLVGDAEPDMLVELITRNFGGWRGEGPAPADPDYGRLADPASRTASVAYPGAPVSVGVAWVRPFDVLPDTMARELDEFAESFATAILNRRLERHARGESAFVGAGAGVSRSREAADITQMSVTARGDNWQGGLTEAFGILADALRAPPSQAEIDRELANVRTAAAASLQAEPTILSPAWANSFVTAVDDRDVVASAATRQAMVETFAPALTPARIEQAMRTVFTGVQPRLLLLSPTAVTPEALNAGLAAAEAAAPSVRGADRQVNFDQLPALGRPGREVSRQRIGDLDVTIVRFANGSTLTFKPTRFEEGQVQVQLRFGNGTSGMDPRAQSWSWASGMVVGGGIGQFDLEDMERLLTGRRLGISFSIDESAFQLSGATRSEELGDELRLLTAKLTAPRWDAAFFRRYQTSYLQAYDLQFSTATSRGQRELPGITHPGDRRYEAYTREALTAATPEQFRSFYERVLAQGPVHAVIVGDTSLDQAIAAVQRTIAALPTRRTPPLAADPALSRPPAPNPTTTRFTHNGDPSQAYAAIGWSTIGGTANLHDRRALALAANLVQARLFERLREDEGASYAPAAAHFSSEIFPNYGILYAASAIRPTRVQDFYRAAREIVADLAARAPSAEEFSRGQNPVVTGIERRLATNAYWIDAIENFATRPQEVPAVRSYLTDYRGLTPEDIRRAVATHVADQGDWSMVVVPERAAPDATPAPAPAPRAPGNGN